MANEPVVKYIVVDEYKPLYALAKAFGPQRGPIRKPILVKIGIIKDLLKQYNGPKIFEVIPVGTEPNGDTIFSDRVELTLDNYNVSWYEIQGMEIPVINGASISSGENEEAAKKADKIADDLNDNSINEDSQKVPSEQIPPSDTISGEEMDEVPGPEEKEDNIASITEPGAVVAEETVAEASAASANNVEVESNVTTSNDTSKRSERRSNKPAATK